MLDVIKRPLVSEKNAIHAEYNTYSFEVDLNATKADIRSAIEKNFRVKVEHVRTMIFRGRFFRKQAGLGKPKLRKKALVKLVEGEKIALFEGA
jgi:large subunit ribosomal protein L23